MEDILGGDVVEAVSAVTGFSPAVAAALTLADGGRAFVKAADPQGNSETVEIYREEARIAAVLPRTAPVPRLIATFEEEGWVVLLFEHVDGRLPAEPWRQDELARVLSMVTDLAAGLTPCPIDAPAIADRYEDVFRGWRRLVAARDSGTDDLSGLDPWAARRLDALAELESSWSDAAEGSTLLHCDLRADNLLLTDDRVIVVDWPWASCGAPWFDLVGLLPSVRMQGGPDPEHVFRSHPLAAEADPDAVTAVLAAMTGYFVRQARQPAPPGLPTLRAFQAAQGRTALPWLRSRLGEGWS
ncbi:aminoglycoside phosphotransferase family protein [Planotetraspora sp. GP83]|uniref:aminoglycoside phosphotransferase family protein n=1 Tax=Planotetraspora sp. GP83 TaxID=3156264 RepID=UPI0035112B5A